MLEGPVWNEPTRSKPCSWRPLNPSKGVAAGSFWRGLSKSWGQAASVVRSAHWGGTEVPFAKAHMSDKVASRVSLPSQPEGANVPQTISRPCCRIAKPSVESQSQADPHLRPTRLSTRRSAAAVRRQLIARQGDRQEELPTVQTSTTQLHSLGDFPKKVTKSPPQKTSLTPRRSLPRCTRAIRPPRAPRTCDASPSRPRRR